MGRRNVPGVVCSSDLVLSFCFFFFKQKTAYEIKECDWSSDVCSSDLNKTIGEVANDEKLGTIVKNIMQEVALVANALKIALPPDIVETSFSKASQFPFETKTSFQRDVETKGDRKSVV